MIVVYSVRLMNSKQMCESERERGKAHCQGWHTKFEFSMPQCKITSLKQFDLKKVTPCNGKPLSSHRNHKFHHSSFLFLNTTCIDIQCNSH